jgi:hypothetical protein
VVMFLPVAVLTALFTAEIRSSSACL